MTFECKLQDTKYYDRSVLLNLFQIEDRPNQPLLIQLFQVSKTMVETMKNENLVMRDVAMRCLRKLNSRPQPFMNHVMTSLAKRTVTIYSLIFSSVLVNKHLTPLSFLSLSLFLGPLPPLLPVSLKQARQPLLLL